MHYTSLQLKNFRSYDEFSIELHKGVNIIVGPNASGKTNLLESILVASRGSSYRASDRALVRHGAEWLRVQAVTQDNHTRLITIKLSGDDKTDKEMKIDTTPFKRMTHNKLVPTVLFEPEHMRMVTGSPDKRREYLDAILGQTEPGYKSNLNRYKKALAQRNRLLKNDRPIGRDDMFVWDVQLSEYGAKINHSRHNLTSHIQRHASTIYSSISRKPTKITVRYAEQSLPSDNYASAMLKSLQANFEADRVRGFTSRGPHREDLLFSIDGRLAASSASRGETRSLVLVCKIIELSIVAQTYNRQPIVLLDDVFSELDGARRQALTEYLKDHQTIITTTDADAVLEHYLQDYEVIPLVPPRD